MANLDPQKMQTLKEMRSPDTVEDKERTPETETLNPEEVRKWLEANKYTVDTVDSFDERFTVEEAIKMLEGSSVTPAERKLAKELKDARDHLEKIRDQNLLEDRNADTFTSTLHKELTASNELDKEADIVAAYKKYHTLKNFALDMLLVQKEFQERRDENRAELEKKKLETAKEGTDKDSLEDDILGVWEDMKKNFSKMSGKEKFGTIAAGVLGAVLLFSKSKNEKIQKFKDIAIGTLKVAGGAGLVGVLFNQGWKLFTGNSGINDVFGSGESEASAEKGEVKDDRWTEIFGDGSEELQKSLVFMGDKDFSKIATAYHKAKTAKKKKLELEGVEQMTPEEIYKAVDSFFSKDPTVQLDKRYKDSTWMQVVASQTAENLDIDNEDFLDSLKSVTREGGIEFWNWLMVGEGLNVVRPMYLSLYGSDKKPSQEQLKEFAAEFFANDVASTAALPRYIERKFPSQHAAPFQQLLKEGRTDAPTGVTTLDLQAEDSLYIMAEVPVVLTNKGQADRQTLEEANNRVLTVLENSDFSHEMKGDFQRYIIAYGGVRVLSDKSYRYFVRVPRPGTPEFGNITMGHLSGKEIAAKGNKELFSENTPINYEQMLKERPWEAEKLRIRFLLDSTQKAELQAVCDWFNDEYAVNKQGLIVKQVYEKMLTDNERESVYHKVLKEVKVDGKPIEQNLNSNAALLKKLEEGTTLTDGIEDIENEAVAGFDGSQEARNALLEQLRRGNGYQIRLAILGDSQARAKTRFNEYEKIKIEFMDEVIPFNGESFLEDYRKWCENFIARKNKGQ